MGDGIQRAIDSGFEKIYSIEITPYYYDLCVERFKNNSNVQIIFGDSTKKLWSILQEIDEAATFWLDGHYSDGTTLYGEKMCPLLDEIDIIAQHHIKNHTILIDDLRCWHESNYFYPHYQFTLKDIVEHIQKINSDYAFTYEDGFIPKDILVAQIIK
jgi:hypothetical protein